MADAANFMFLSRRNDSLTGSAGPLVAVSLAALTLGLAMLFAVLDAWIVLLFAAIEVMALQIAFSRLRAGARDFDLVRIFNDEVEVTVRRRETYRTFRCDRSRVRLELAGDAGGEPGWIVLRSRGDEVAFGAHLSGERRTRLARELCMLLAAAQHTDEPMPVPAARAGSRA